LINPGGVLNGVGQITGNFVDAGGIVHQEFEGNPPGDQQNSVRLADDVVSGLTIDGNFQDDPGGTLDMQIGGADPADYGHLTVTGTADIEGPVLLDFMNGFGPQAGDVYDLFTFDGGANDFSADIQVLGLAPGWQYEIEQVGDELEIESLNDGIATTPEPATAAWLLAPGLLLRRRPTLTSPLRTLDKNAA
jgi:hypothetical protein